MTQADFSEAERTTAALLGMNITPEVRLFALHNWVRIAELTDRKLAAGETLDKIEQAYNRVSQPGGWVQHWYVYSWLLLPFTCDYAIDIFYLHHLARELPQVVMRQRCIARTVQYGVQQRDHNFMLFIMEHLETSENGTADPYYRSKTNFLLDIYRRDYTQLRIDADNLRRAADTPLHEVAATRLIKQYSHLIAQS